jgi:hypothetical protein
VSHPSRGRGCEVRSADHKRARFGGIHLALGIALGAAPAYARSSDLTPHCQYRLDQGQSSACGGHAPAVWLLIAASIAGVDLGFAGPPSQRHIYGCARCVEDKGPGPLEDSGVEPADPIIAIASCGVRGMPLTSTGTIALTADGRCSDVQTAEDLVDCPGAVPNVGLRPTAAELAESARDLVLGAYAIEPTSQYFCELVAAALSGDPSKGIKPRPVAVCIWADDPFEKWGEGDPIATKPPLAGAVQWGTGGGHYVTIAGHTTLPDGTLAFLILNSWSAKWGVVPPSGGLAGLIWVTASWLKASASEAYGIDLMVKAAA